MAAIARSVFLLPRRTVSGRDADRAGFCCERRAERDPGRGSSHDQPADLAALLFTIIMMFALQGAERES